MTFLADAHERGVLRQVGPVYQFRHIELQRRLSGGTESNISPAAPEDCLPEYRHGRIRIFPRPPVSSHPIPGKIYFWLVFLTSTTLCISILVASITPIPAHNYSPTGAILAGFGIMTSIWFGLYAYRIPSGKVTNSAIWSAIARYVAPWTSQERSNQDSSTSVESDDPERAFDLGSFRPGKNNLANHRDRPYPFLLTALIGAVFIALLAVVLSALTAVPDPDATLPHSSWIDLSKASFSPNSTTLATVDSDAGVVLLWNVASRKVTATLSDPHVKRITDAVFSPDGTTVAIGDLNGSTYLWNVASSKLTATLTDPHGQGIYDAVFSPDGTTLAAEDSNGSIYLWNLASSKLTATLTDPHGQDIDDPLFSPNGITLATTEVMGSSISSIQLWDVASGRLIATLPHSQGIYSPTFSPDGSTLAAADGEDSVYLWNVASDKLTATLTDPHGQGCYTVLFSPDGTTLAAADFDGSTYLWNVASGRLAATFPDPHSQGVFAAAFSPDGTTLAAADNDGSTYLWNVASGKLAATLPDPDGQGVNAAVFSPDGTTLAAADDYDNIYLWKVSRFG